MNTSEQAVIEQTKQNPYEVFLDANYDKFVKFAENFVQEMSGDGEFQKPELNFVAVEMAVVGHIYSQPWFSELATRAVEGHPRENVFLVVQDTALQAATDATMGNPRFETK